MFYIHILLKKMFYIYMAPVDESYLHWYWVEIDRCLSCICVLGLCLLRFLMKLLLLIKYFYRVETIVLLVLEIMCWSPPRISQPWVVAALFMNICCKLETPKCCWIAILLCHCFKVSCNWRAACGVLESMMHTMNLYSLFPPLLIKKKTQRKVHYLH